MGIPAKWGGEFKVNALTTGDQHDPAVTALVDGKFVVIWTDENGPLGDASGSAVVGQIYNADGSQYGGEFLVNKNVKAGDQTSPAVTALDDGGFTVVWQSLKDAAHEIRGRTFDTHGIAAGGEFKIGNVGVAAGDALTSVATLADGHIIATWTVTVGNGPTEAVRAQVFETNGAAVGPLIEYSGISTHSDSDVTALQDGRFVMAWTEKVGNTFDCRAQIYNANGIKSGAEFSLNTSQAGGKLNPSLATLSDGRFVATWTNDLGDPDIVGQMFNANGSKIGGAFEISGNVGILQDYSDVAALKDGGFIVTWRTVSTGNDVVMQAYDAAGNPVGGIYGVNDNTSGDQGLDGRVVATLADGRFVIAFDDHSAGVDGSGSAVRAQIFDPRSGGLAFFGTTLDDQRVGTNFTDFLSGGNGDDILDGRGEKDSLTGGAGDDELRGGDADDSLNGGSGGDWLDGGAGKDTATYISSAQGVTVNLLTTGGSGGDAEGDKLIAIENVVGSNFGDTLSGNSSANTLEGRGGTDTLYGGNLADVLIGGAGGDNLDGGSGIDTASYPTSIGSVAVSLVNGNGVGADAAGDHLTSIENLVGSDFADLLIGNADANKIESGKGGDAIESGGGLDILVGGLGDDTYGVEAVGEFIIENASEGTDLVKANNTFQLYANVENLVLLGTADIDGSGNELVNVITGNSGNNKLDGKGEADTLSGLGGNDTYYVDNAGDKVTEGVGNGTLDWVATSTSYVLAAGVEVEKLSTTSSGGTTAIDLTGNEFSQTINGNAGANKIDGKGGADTMSGLGGDDTYFVDNAGDKAIESVGGGLDLVATSVSFVLGVGSEIEIFSTTSSASIDEIDLTGNEFVQTMTGNAGANRINGAAGADTMSGLGGDDVYIVDNAGDVVVEGAGQGTLDWVATSVTFVLTAGIEVEKISTTLSGGTDAINLTGNELVQVMTGNAGDNKLDGKGGGDTMSGLGDDDTYYVDNAGDIVKETSTQGVLDWVATSVSYALSASAYIEKLSTTSSGGTTAIDLTGNGISQTIVGNARANTISGKTGNDTLTGLGGADVFVFDTTLNAATNVDAISDFSVGDDTISLAGSVFAQIAGTGTLSAAQFVANATGLAADSNDRIVYETDTGKLFYDSNGSAAGGSVLFATLDADLALTNADFIVI